MGENLLQVLPLTYMDLVCHSTFAKVQFIYQDFAYGNLNVFVSIFLWLCSRERVKYKNEKRRKINKDKSDLIRVLIYKITII